MLEKKTVLLTRDTGNICWLDRGWFIFSMFFYCVPVYFCQRLISVRVCWVGLETWHLKKQWLRWHLKEQVSQQNPQMKPKRRKKKSEYGLMDGKLFSRYIYKFTNDLSCHCGSELADFFRSISYFLFLFILGVVPLICMNLCLMKLIFTHWGCIRFHEILICCQCPWI